MIFPRSRRARNAIRAAACVLLVSAAGCARLPAHPANVSLEDAHNNGYRLAFSSTSDTLASAGSEGRVRLWQLPQANELAAWQAHDGSIHGLVFLEHDHALLSAGYDRTLALWERDGRLRLRRDTPSSITDLAADEAAGLVVTGHTDGVVRVWSLPQLQLRTEQRLHHGTVRAVDYHHGTRRYASSGRDGRVLVWRDGETPVELASPPSDAHDLAFAPDGRTLTGSGWFSLFRWRLDDSRALAILPTEHHGLIKSIQYTRDGRSIASISRDTDSAVDLLDAATGAVTRRFQPHELCGSYVLLSPDQRYLASTSDDASVHVWDLAHLIPVEPQMNTDTQPIANSR